MQDKTKNLKKLIVEAPLNPSSQFSISRFFPNFAKFGARILMKNYFSRPLSNKFLNKEERESG